MNGSLACSMLLTATPAVPPLSSRCPHTRYNSTLVLSQPVKVLLLQSAFIQFKREDWIRKINNLLNSVLFGILIDRKRPSMRVRMDGKIITATLNTRKQIHRDD